jgi:transcriptional regulator with XRE-family HTH domain
MKDPNYADWLRAQFTVHPDKNKAELARALGLEPPAISKILSGMRQIKAHEYLMMRRFFGLPVDGEKAISPPAYAGAHTGALHDSGDLLPPEWDIPAAIQPARQQPQQDTAHNIFTVTDHFMEPAFTRDETVLIDPQDRTPTPSGTFVVSDRFSHMVRLCEMVPGSNPPEVNVMAADKSFQTQTLKLGDFEILGRVVGKVSWLK